MVQSRPLSRYIQVPEQEPLLRQHCQPIKEEPAMNPWLPYDPSVKWGDYSTDEDDPFW